MISVPEATALRDRTEQVGPLKVMAVFGSQE